MATFSTKRKLLNPKFEGYKLSILEQDEHVAVFPLTAHPTQANVSGRTRTPLSFEEVQSRITHNHLAISHDSRAALYIDDEFRVIEISVDANSTPTFKVLCDLPRPIQSTEFMENTHREYPTAQSLSDGSWLVSDGSGSLLVFSRVDQDISIAAMYILPTPATLNTPFRIHSAHIHLGSAVCVLSSRHIDSSGVPVMHKQNKNRNPQFDIWLVLIPLDTRLSAPQALDPLWHGKGDDVPMHVSYDNSRKAFFILGGSRYVQLGAPEPPSYEPTKNELAPIPRAGESLPDTVPKPPPYSWTQTSDSVTINFLLPSIVSKENIRVTLTMKTISLHINHELPTSIELPHCSLKQFWDTINPSTSFWTWEREENKHISTLTFHLDKQHEDTRWSHVFAAAEEGTDVEVPETLDPSVFAHIREQLEKYTAALQTGEDVSGLGLGAGVPSLAEGERDESVDTVVGRPFSITWLCMDGTEPTWTGLEGVQSYLLSMPMPGLAEPHPSLVIQGDIEGLYYTLPPAEQVGESLTMWEHTSTFPALSFVLASKRDSRFRFHLGSKMVLAFESGSGFGGGNVYIYRSSKPNEVHARQSILRVSGGTSGALLGVGMVKRSDGQFVWLCLCEKDIVVVKDLA